MFVRCSLFVYYVCQLSDSAKFGHVLYYANGHLSFNNFEQHPYIPPPKNMAILKVGVECYGDRGLLPQNSTATWARCHNHSMIMVIIKILIMIVIMTTMTAAIMTMNTTMAMTMNMTS